MWLAKCYPSTLISDFLTRPYTSRKISRVYQGIEHGTSWMVDRRADHCIKQAVDIWTLIGKKISWAPPHFTNIVRAFLEEQFPARWFGRGSSYMTWPARSPDLTPADCFVCGSTGHHYVIWQTYKKEFVLLSTVTSQILHNTHVEFE